MKVKSTFGFCINLVCLVAGPWAGFKSATLIWVDDPLLALLTAGLYVVFLMRILGDVLEAVVTFFEEREV